MDAQIWYAVWSTLFGGLSGFLAHLGEVGIAFSSFSFSQKTCFQIR